MNVKKTDIFICSLISLLLLDVQSYSQNAFVEDLANCITVSEDYIPNLVSNNTVAKNDTFELLINCHGNILSENVLTNDSISGNKSLKVCFVYAHELSELTFGSDGSITYKSTDGFRGIIHFSYELCELDDDGNKQEAEVVIYVHNDFDCDLIADENDLDDDNDGILDIDEGDGLLDSDLDSLPDSFDIDSDNDGIPDNIEWQKEGEFITQLESDLNQNGWDDAFDITSGGNYYEPVDTDNNGIPDYLDTDSDNDSILDYIEGFDDNDDGKADIEPQNSDTDKDGLDDAYDLISDWSIGFNSAGSNCTLPDNNKNGIRDWRDKKAAIPGEENPTLEFSPEEYIFPNPSNGYFTLNIPGEFLDGEAIFSLFDIYGKLICQRKVQNGLTDINVQKSLSGFYLVKITSSSFNYNQKITLF